MLSRQFLEFQSLKKKALRGVLALGGKRVVVQLVQTAANIILARILFPQDFGALALIIFLLNIFILISDIGLGASLVQRRKEPTTDELRTIFTTHLSLGILAVILMWMFIPVYINLYEQQLRNYTQLLYLSALSLFLYNLKIIPNSLLARSIYVPRLVVGEISELLVLEVVTVGLALLGKGVASFVWGFLISRAFAAILFFVLRPWPIGIRFSSVDLKKYLPFGLQYYLNTVIGTLNGAVAPVLIGGLLGITALGFVNWAAGVGALPRSLGEIVGWMLFPVGARVQHDKIFLRKIVERALEFTTMVSFPLVTVMLALAKPLTYIVFTGKWEQGIPLLYLFIIQSGFLVFSVLFTNALLGIGEARVVRNINLLGVIAQWILTVILVKTFGILGYGWAALLSSTIFFVQLLELKRHVPLTLARHSLPYFFYASVAGIITYGYSLIFSIQGVLNLVFAVFIGLLSYGALLYLFQRRLILHRISSLMKMYNV